MKIVPPGVVLAEKKAAADLIPVGLGVGGARNSEVLGWTADRPASLGDPEWLALRSVGNVTESLLEEGSALVDTVDLSVLEVWVRVNTKEVNSADNVAVAAVDPGGPGVNVTDGGTRESGTSNSRADLVDVRDKDAWLLAWVCATGLNGRWRDAVKILATDRNTGNERSEVSSVLGDGVLQSSELAVEGSLVLGGPETKQKTGLGGNGGWDGGDDGVGGAALDHGVETGRVETRGASQVLSGGEHVLEVGLCECSTADRSATIVETLVLGESRAHAGCKSQDA